MTWGAFFMGLGAITVVGLFVQLIVYERRNRRRD
jgi:hypothetical protein